MFTEAKKNAPIVLFYDNVSLFLVFLLKSDVPSALLLGRLFQQYKISKIIAF